MGAHGAVGLGLLGVVGSYVYINFVREEAPERLDTAPEVIGSVDPNVTLEGTWAVAEGSQVGYRVEEILFGQEADAVGRTSDVTGSFTIDGSALTEGSFEADMTTVTKRPGAPRRQFRGRIMEVDRYPTATFKLAEPLDLSGIDLQQTDATATATGDLTVHGVTNEVTFEINGVRSGSTIQITGSIPIVFAAYNVDNPSGWPARTGDDGLLEFVLNFEKRA